MLKHETERFAFWCVRTATKILPRSVILATGRFVGWIAFHADRRHRFVALQNFSLAFPETTAAQARRTISKCYQFFGGYLFDMLSHFPKLDPDRMKEFEFEGLDRLDAAYARGKGVICVTGHWGAWELMGILHGYKGYSLGVVVRRLDNPYLDSLLERLRGSTGNFIIKKTEGFRPMLRAMREGKGIAILIDQNIRTEDRIFVEFFGRPAATTPAVGLLKLKTDATLIPAFALPLPRNRYRFIYCNPVEISYTGDRKEDVQRITQACTRAIEEQIRQYPEYWLWMHRRWKTQPEQEIDSGDHASVLRRGERPEPAAFH